MGTIFEELIRRLNEENNEEAGEHFTPRDVVELLANLVFLPLADRVESGTYLVYDGACGTGGMLTVSEANTQAPRKRARQTGGDSPFRTDAIPAAISVGPAKEMVGQPFLRDHELAAVLKGSRGGPVHVIACHKTALETQATKLLGFSDTTVVTAPFGVFVADNIQKIQFAFIVNCRDESNTRHGVQRFFEWLAQTREETHLADRARARARIVRALAKEATA